MDISLRIFQIILMIKFEFPKVHAHNDSKMHSGVMYKEKLFVN